MNGDEYGTNFPFLQGHDQRKRSMADQTKSAQFLNLNQSLTNVVRRKYEKQTMREINRPENNDMIARHIDNQYSITRAMHDKKRAHRENLEKRFQTIHLGNTNKDAPYETLEAQAKKSEQLADKQMEEINVAWAAREADNRAKEQKKKEEARDWYDVNKKGQQLMLQEKRDKLAAERENIKKHEQYLYDLKIAERRAKHAKNLAYKDELNAQIRQKMDEQVRSLT